MQSERFSGAATMEGLEIVEESAFVVATALAPCDINETSPVLEIASADPRMNSGSYRKRKAKKQLGAEMTLEDLRGIGSNSTCSRDSLLNSD